MLVADLLFWVRVAYPAPDTSAESTMALRMFAGKQVVHILYADSSGEINKSLKSLNIMLQGSQLGVPQANAAAEMSNGDVLAGTR